MTWSKFDDGYDEHEKIENAWFDDHATIGLHAMATTACNRWLSDGVIRPRWLQQKLPVARRHSTVVAAMVTHGLFDVLKAGATVELQDSAGNAIHIGPYGEDRYIVHDFLDRHDSSVQVKERRRKDAARKQQKPDTGKPTGIRSESARTPTGALGDSEASRARGRANAGAPPDPTRPDPKPPLPPKGERKRERDVFDEECAAFALIHFPQLPGGDGRAAVRQAVTYGKATTLDAVTAFIDEHFESAA